MSQITKDQVVFTPAPREGPDMFYMDVPGRKRTTLRGRYLGDALKSALCPVCRIKRTFICHHT